MLQSYVVSAFETYNKSEIVFHCSQEELLKCCTKGTELQVFSCVFSSMLSYTGIVRKEVCLMNPAGRGESLALDPLDILENSALADACVV